MQRRFSGSIAAIVVFSVALAAGCGGGGGGGSTGGSVVPNGPAPSANPSTSPGGPSAKPSGSPAPGGSSSASPSGAPSNNPSPLPSVTSLPSVQPSVTSPPTPQPTVTSPPPTPTPTPGPLGWNGSKLTTTPEITPGPSANPSATPYRPDINGQDNMFTPTTGDTHAGDPGATPTGGGHGPTHSTVDNVSCEVEMSNNYHIHIFLGLYVNRQEYAIPRGIGAVEPFVDQYGSVPHATQCYYFLHTHDATGVIHVEDLNNNVIESPPLTSHYTLKTLFDIWGITVNSSQFGQFQGAVRVYTSGQEYRGGGKNVDIPVSDLTWYNGDPNNIPLYSHEVIWFLVGPSYPTSVPSIHFYEEY